MITFITPTYNHRRYIQRCIKSVMEQTAPCRQIIIDDGSTDGTSEIAAAYVTNNIRFVRQEHAGIGRLAETYNRALSMVETDNIAILEGDDYSHPDRAELSDKALKAKPFAFGYIKKEGDHGSFLGYFPDSDFSFMPQSEFVKLMLASNQIPAASVAIRTEALKTIGGFQPGSHYVDYPTWLALLSRFDFGFIPSVLSCWTVYPGSVCHMNEKKAEIWKDAISAYGKYSSLRVIPKPQLEMLWGIYRARRYARKLKQWKKINKWDEK
jgi:glycosyltransferase involved in cell wall biosynthesis